MSDTATTTSVYAPDDLVWHRNDMGREFWLSEVLVGGDYTSAYNAQLSRFGPGGGSPSHDHPYNHVFFFLSGTARVQMGGRSWLAGPGTFVKVPAHQRHSVTNTGLDDVTFLVIYDPPSPDVG
jgi:quercetin dioxygenase-like cupin family protein